MSTKIIKAIQEYQIRIETPPVPDTFQYVDESGNVIGRVDLKHLAPYSVDDIINAFCEEISVNFRKRYTALLTEGGKIGHISKEYCATCARTFETDTVTTPCPHCGGTVSACNACCHSADNDNGVACEGCYNGSNF